MQSKYILIAPYICIYMLPDAYDKSAGLSVSRSTLFLALFLCLPDTMQYLCVDLDWSSYISRLLVSIIGSELLLFDVRFVAAYEQDYNHHSHNLLQLNVWSHHILKLTHPHSSAEMGICLGAQRSPQVSFFLHLTWPLLLICCFLSSDLQHTTTQTQTQSYDQSGSGILSHVVQLQCNFTDQILTC